MVEDDKLDEQNLLFELGAEEFYIDIERITAIEELHQTLKSCDIPPHFCTACKSGPVYPQF
jgi:hypothetical protein